MSLFYTSFCIIELIVVIVNSFTEKNQKLYSADIIQVKKYGTKPISGTNSLTNATVRHRKNTVQITKERCLPKNKGLLVQRSADWHIDFYGLKKQYEADNYRMFIAARYSTEIRSRLMFVEPWLRGDKYDEFYYTCWQKYGITEQLLTNTRNPAHI